MQPDQMAKVISLCSRRGFLFPSGEIYGTLAGFFDYGSYGAGLKRNIEQNWWDFFVSRREDIVGMDGSIISSPQIWSASGHLKEFTDPLVECGKCRSRFRADQLIEDELKISVEGLSVEALNALLEEKKLKCEKCGGELQVAKPFNLMFKTHVGASEDETAAAYLRPETAQLIFSNFKQVQLSSRKQLPFGIAQIGKAFRNEISPRNFVFRCREFSQMEVEYFVHPEKLDDCPLLEGEDLSLEILVLTAAMQEKKQAEGKRFTFRELVEKKVIGSKWHAYLTLLSYKWFISLGIRKANLRLREHVKAELSHYSKETWDLEYLYPWGWKELSGIANRSDYDLKQHMLGSKADLSYFDERSKAKVIPFVIEPSFGLERALLTVLLDAYEEKSEKTESPGTEGTTGENGKTTAAQKSQKEDDANTTAQKTKKGEKKAILHLHPKLSPLKAAVFPLMKKDGLAEKARELFLRIKDAVPCEYDDSGSIGRRYARQDEVGTPFCITIDYDTLKDDTVTIRERDSALQKRIKTGECVQLLQELIGGKPFSKIS